MESEIITAALTRLQEDLGGRLLMLEGEIGDLREEVAGLRAQLETGPLAVLANRERDEQIFRSAERAVLGLGA